MTRKCRVVVDTNVIVSFFLRYGSTPWRAVRHAIEHDELVMSEAILAELHEVLRRPRFDRYVSRALCEQFLVTVPRFATTVPIARSIRVCDDPSDDKFLEAAVDGGAQFLVTGDRALLAMKTFRNVEIVTPSAYLRARLQRL
jgi:putative PIN family toxin of toxin-antitoxin system